MLTEGASVVLGTLVATLVACGLLVLGVLDLLWPVRRRPVRQAPAAPRRDRTPTPAREEPRLHGEPAPTPAPMTAIPGAGPEPAPAPAVDPAEVLERCRRLVAAERPGDAVAAAMAVLERPAGIAPGVVAALWREVGAARAAVGDHDGALAAFRAAIEAAPAAERDGLRRELAVWASGVARELTIVAPPGADGFTAVRAARAILDAAAEASGPDRSLESAHADLAPVYWPAYEAHLRGLVDAQDFSEAYRLATEALADATLPAERRALFETFRAQTLTSRIASLVGRAVASIDDNRDWEAVGALERAETLFRSASGLPAEHRDDLVRCMAAVYARLGKRRVESGDFEDAIDPLFRAFRIGAIDAGERDDLRWTMVQALKGVVEARVAMIREVAAAGSRDSAAVQAEKLWQLLRSGMAAGVPQESLTQALATTRRLLDDLGVSGS